jgi:hypothetical protein
MTAVVVVVVVTAAVCLLSVSGAPEAGLSRVGQHLRGRHAGGRGRVAKLFQLIERIADLMALNCQWSSLDLSS